MQNMILRVTKNAQVLLAVHLLVIGTLSGVTGQLAAQSQKPPYAADPASLSLAIAKVEKGDFGLVDVEIIARRHAVQAIPSLENQFEQSKDLTAKAKIANALVRLGQHDGPYWEFLANRANTVLVNDPPTPVDYDVNGTAISDQLSKKLVEWANKHQLSVQDAWRYTMIDASEAIMNLGSSDDKRAIPILRSALGSQDDFIKIAAAQGLAQLQDTESIPEIIKACETSPKDAAASIAQSLVYFDDVTAQRAVDVYVPKDMAQVLRTARAHGKTPYS
jgi:HEAT repeats